jgi:hypothetical protein
MADLEGKSSSNSRQESQSRAAKANFSLRTDRQQSSPRAFLAFSALRAFDWVTEKFSSLAHRVFPSRTNREARSKAEPDVSARSAQVRSVVGIKALLALMFFASRPCLGGTIYNNLGPNDSFTINRGYETNFTLSATSFTTTDGGKLDSILTSVFSLISPVTFTLYNDSNGQPGTLLESPYRGTASLGTVHALSLNAGKSATVSVGYRAF